MCNTYASPLHGSVDTSLPVRAGTLVTITCDQGYVADGTASGASQTPLCLDSGEFERGVTCVATPCPCCEQSSETKSTPKCTSEGGGGKDVASFVATPKEIRQWEDEVEHPHVFNYVPNVFDHEPRPTTWGT
eukprot:CAMPEP_0173400020 /NCGR_PEP_ID=MMETSP1356-20130122/46716_1 /TAXON_ID=77927 ORGANISM="Hemiselmis virescens, Strain PCC157" /NCGR_SAMPLE_ID=MMETSP1356 /ASSEMBLY_ACC=CAM_ASM_000847 /LENGTH=131 /DNA_ID=CAMNT_0014359873 /DNA_START=22 /DNA_END=417 /DNA_ORIENTATION=+